MPEPAGLARLTLRALSLPSYAYLAGDLIMAEVNLFLLYACKS